VTLKAFLFLLVVTIVAVTGAALIAEALLPPGFERGIVIAVLSGLVVFPAARWAEYRGWIQGAWSPGGEARRQRDARKALEAGDASPTDPQQKAEDAQPGALSGRTEDSQQPPAGQTSSALAGDLKLPGDTR
jgi:hypothetical protein